MAISALAPQWIKDVTRPLRRAPKRVWRWASFTSVAWPPSRAVLNAVVNARIPGVSARLLGQLSVSTWKPRRSVTSGHWRVRLVDRTVTVPLGPDLPLLNALQLLHHDAGVKRVYLHVLRHAPPDLFLDVGANVGRDSFVFRASGVPTISFEPNARCHPEIGALAAAAGVPARIEHVAISDSEGETTLFVPQGRSWLGSIEPTTIAALQQVGRPLQAMTVQLRRLDDHLPECLGRRVLLKIDTEGNERAVLRGAAAILRDVRPAVVFEAWRGPPRAVLYDLLRAAGYTLRIADRPPQAPLSATAFAAAPETNFLALPEGEEARWEFG